MSDQQLEYTGCWIPASIMLDERLTDLDQKIYGIVNGFTSNGKKFWASNARIKTWVRAEEDSISGSITRLVNLNLMTRTINQKEGNRRELEALRPLSGVQPIPIGSTTDTLSDGHPTIYNKDNINNNNKAFRPSVASAPVATPIEDSTSAGTVEDQANKAIAAMYEKKVKAAEKRAKAKLLASFEPEFESIYSIWPKRPDKIEAYGCWKAAISTGISNETLLSAAKKEAIKGQYCKNLLSWLQNKCWEVQQNANSCDYKPQNNRFDKPDHTKVAPQQDKRLLFLSNRYPNISPEWLKLGINESEYVLEEINNKWCDYCKMDFRSAINGATTQVHNRVASSNIFAEMMKLGVDNKNEGDKTEE